MVGPWHSAQLLVMPVWRKAELAKLAPSGTGVLVMLEPAPTWQFSQLSVRIGTWLAPGPTMARLAVLYSVAFVSLWHCTQLALVDWMLAWMSATVGEVPQLLWQAVHDVPLT